MDYSLARTEQSVLSGSEVQLLLVIFDMHDL